MNIRRATTDDSGQIAELIKALTLKFIAVEMNTAAAQHFLTANNEAAIVSFIEQGFIYFVAENAMVADMATATTPSQPQLPAVEIIGCIGMRDNSHVYHMFIAETWQGRGLARCLWQQAKNFCEAAGNSGVFTVNSSNHAVAVYQAFGFVRTGPMQQMHGVFYNPMQWRQQLQPV